MDKFIKKATEIWSEIAASNGDEEFDPALLIAEALRNERRECSREIETLVADWPTTQDGLEEWHSPAQDGQYLADYILSPLKPKKIPEYALPATDGVTSYDVAEGILGLIGKSLDPTTYSEWSWEQIEQAVDYAGCCHLKAGDNDDVEVPPMPEHVKTLPELTLGPGGLWPLRKE